MNLQRFLYTLLLCFPLFCFGQETKVIIKKDVRTIGGPYGSYKDPVPCMAIAHPTTVSLTDDYNKTTPATLIILLIFHSGIDGNDQCYNFSVFLKNKETGKRIPIQSLENGYNMSFYDADDPEKLRRIEEVHMTVENDVELRMKEWYCVSIYSIVNNYYYYHKDDEDKLTNNMIINIHPAPNTQFIFPRSSDIELPEYSIYLKDCKSKFKELATYVHDTY